MLVCVLLYTFWLCIVFYIFITSIYCLCTCMYLISFFLGLYTYVSDWPVISFHTIWREERDLIYHNTLRNEEKPLSFQKSEESRTPMKSSLIAAFCWSPLCLCKKYPERYIYMIFFVMYMWSNIWTHNLYLEDTKVFYWYLWMTDAKYFE